MKYIADYICDMEDEINGAKEYAEKYLYNKAQGNQTRMKMYYEMSQDELKHVGYVHEILSDEINRLKQTYTPPQEMEEEWVKSHKVYVERVAWIKQMLAM